MEITHLKDRNAFVAMENGQKLGELTYRLSNNVVNFNHTYVNPIARGRGVARQLVDAGAEFVQDSGYKAKGDCSYADKVLKESYPQLLV